MDNYNFLGAGLAIGLACLGVAIGQAFLVFKTMDTVGKNPHLSTFFLTMTILGIALLESAAIYGLLIALKTISTNFVDTKAAIGVGLSIGLTGFGAGIGEGLIISKSIEAVNFNPDYRNKIMAYMILFVALIESSAIYGFIISLQILGDTNIIGTSAIGASLAIGLSGVGVAIGEGILSSKAILIIGKDERDSKLIIPFSILGVALVETAAIYGLIIAIQILSKDFGLLSIGAGLAIGLAGIGVSLGESNALSNALNSIINRKNKFKSIITMSVLGVALIESAAIYGLIIAMQVLQHSDLGISSLGVGFAIGLAGAGVSLGEGFLVGKTMSTIGIERVNISKIITNMILYIALVESAAIYAFIISFMIIDSENMNLYASLGAGLAIGLAGAGVGIGEGLLSSRSVFISGKRPRFSSYFLTVTILGIALVESAAIYSLIIAYQILQESKESIISIGAGLSIGLTGLGAGFAEGYLVSGCFKAMARNPENRVKDLTFMILFVALIEVLAIYGMFIAFSIMK